MCIDLVIVCAMTIISFKVNILCIILNDIYSVQCWQCFCQHSLYIPIQIVDKCVFNLGKSIPFLFLSGGNAIAFGDCSFLISLCFRDLKSLASSVSIWSRCGQSLYSISLIKVISPERAPNLSQISQFLPR